MRCPVVCYLGIFLFTRSVLNEIKHLELFVVKFVNVANCMLDEIVQILCLLIKFLFAKRKYFTQPDFSFNKLSLIFSGLIFIFNRMFFLKKIEIRTEILKLQSEKSV